MSITANPIIEREFRVNLKKWQIYLVRSAFVLSLIPPLLMVGTGGASALAAREAFLVLMWVQLGCAVFLAPVFTAGTLCSERRKRTLGTLLLSDLSALEIVRGMFLPRAAYLTMVILGSLPVLILWILFGSITWTEIIQAQVVIIAVAILGASVGMFFSAITKTVVTALLCSYVTLILLLGAGPVMTRVAMLMGFMPETAFFPNPIEILADLLSVAGALGEVRGTDWRWATGTVLCLVPVLPFLGAASRLLHPFRYERMRARARRLADRFSFLMDWPRYIFPFLEKETAGRFANPIAWRELYTSAWFGFRGAVLLTGVMVVISIPVWVATLSSWKSLWLHQLVVGAELYFITLAATVVSASSVSQEKETLSLDVLPPLLHPRGLHQPGHPTDLSRRRSHGRALLLHARPLRVDGIEIPPRRAGPLHRGPPHLARHGLAGRHHRPAPVVHRPACEPPSLRPAGDPGRPRGGGRGVSDHGERSLDLPPFPSFHARRGLHRDGCGQDAFGAERTLLSFPPLRGVQ
ncbi:MAG: ABC transporter permease [Planctomycetota bacterium]